MAPGRAFASPIAGNGLDDDRDGPGLFDALQSQLGLRLPETKVSLDVLVADHADIAPTENQYWLQKFGLPLHSCRGSVTPYEPRI